MQTTIRTRDDDEPLTSEELKKKVIQASTPVLISMAVHMLLMIVLGLWMFAVHTRVDIELVASADGPEEIFDSLAVTNSSANNLEMQSAPVVTSVALTNPFATTTPLPIDPFGTQAQQIKVEGGALSSRSQAAQEYMVGKRGGNRASQSAVGNGLQWLADRQDRVKGSWKLQGYDRKDGVELVLNENLQAATAMAMLAFQGAGHTHKTGRYKDNVERGLKFLLSNQTSDGNFCARLRNEEMLYAHAQCTIAICELLALTQDEKLKEAAQRAVKFCVDSQDTTLGGWRYRPGFDSDVSVTGWMVVALKSATYSGIKVPDEVFDRVMKFLDEIAAQTYEAYPEIDVNEKKIKLTSGSVYSYQVGQKPTNVMTANAILIRQYLGWSQDDARIKQAGEILLAAFSPTWAERDVYYWYYATQMFSHLEGPAWKQWNDAMRDMMVERQVTAETNKGSWNPLGSGTNQANGADFWCTNGAGGRLYVTCMSLYILEVYYRHMPIYQVRGREKDGREKDKAAP